MLEVTPFSGNLRPRTFIREPSPGETFYNRPSSWDLHLGAFIVGPSPATLRRGTFSGQPSSENLCTEPLSGPGPPHKTHFGGPSLGTFTEGPSLASLHQGIFFSRPCRDACPNTLLQAFVLAPIHVHAHSYYSKINAPKTRKWFSF